MATIESLIEAKGLCYTMAIRNAIESLTVFIQSTATVDNYQLKNDLVQAIASGYIYNLKIDNETVERRTIYYKISGYVNPNSVKNIVQNRIQIEKKSELPGIDENEYIKIIKVVEDGDKIKIFYRSKGSNYNEPICVDYYDIEGEPIEGDKRYTEEGLFKGEYRWVYFYKPTNAKSYRIWLPK